MSVHLPYVKKDTKSMCLFSEIYVQNPGNLCQKVTYLCQNAGWINVGPKPNGHIHMSKCTYLCQKSIHFCQKGHLFMSKFTLNFCQKWHILMSVDTYWMSVDTYSMCPCFTCWCLLHISMSTVITSRCQMLHLLN